MLNSCREDARFLKARTCDTPEVNDVDDVEGKAVMIIVSYISGRTDGEEDVTETDGSVVAESVVECRSRNMLTVISRN